MEGLIGWIGLSYLSRSGEGVQQGPSTVVLDILGPPYDRSRLYGRALPVSLVARDSPQHHGVFQGAVDVRQRTEMALVCAEGQECLDE
jgi:hypothetical protein